VRFYGNQRVFIWIAVGIFIGRWMLRLKPKMDISKKYSRKVIFLAQLPFGSSWKKIWRKKMPLFLSDINMAVRYFFSFY
jgi:hypothetical protein